MESQWPIWPWNKCIFTGSKCIIHFLINSVEWVCLCIRCDKLCVCVCVCARALSCFICIWPFATPWTIAHQAPLSMGFSGQEYRSGLSCPPSEGHPHPGIEPSSLMSPALAGGFFTTSTTWETPSTSCICLIPELSTGGLLQAWASQLGWPLTTCGSWALDMWSVQFEMYCQHKTDTREQIVKIPYEKRKK